MSAPAAGGGFFDDVPTKGYVREDVALDVLATGSRDSSVVATIRYVRLVLDPGRRDLALDFWPQREVLLVERASGERLVFERLSGIVPAARDDALHPVGRIGLESGGVIETFGRPGSGAASACAGLDGLIRFGRGEIPVAQDDLTVPTVRLGIEQLVAAALSPREIEVVSETVPILLRAESQGLPVAPLSILEILFPGRHFARSAAALTFRVSKAAPLDPSSPPWSSITRAPEMTAGVPAH
ncbi:MAG: hypothetical protein ACM3JH_07705 [Acidithiobacillales bacterium]